MTRNRAVQGFRRDVADGRDFGEGEAAGAELFIRDFRQIFRLGKSSVREQFFEPPEMFRRRGVKLLVRDGQHERLKRRAPRLVRQPARPTSRMSRAITGSAAARCLSAAAVKCERFHDFLDFGDAFGGFLRL